MGIEGTVVAITGASSGIGRATAKLLAERGCAVVLGARREAKLAAAYEIAAADGRAAFRATDVTRRADLDALVALAVERFDRLDVIVNNAGIGPISRFHALRVEDWDAMLDINLRGTLYGIAAALPVFTLQEGGHVVNVLSTAGLKILPTNRLFREQTGETPAKAVERLRLEAVRSRVEAGFEPIEVIAAAVGLSDPERMRRAFIRRYGHPPQAVRCAAHGMP